MTKGELEKRLTALEALVTQQAQIIDQQAKRIAEQDAQIQQLQDYNRRQRSALLFSGGLADGMKKLLSTDKRSFPWRE